MNKPAATKKGEAKYIGALLLVLCAIVAYIAYRDYKDSKVELLSKNKERAIYGLIHKQFDLINGSIYTFIQSNGFYSLPEEVFEKTNKECSPLLFKVVTADSFVETYKGELKQPNLPVYQPTYDCINKIIQAIPLGDNQFIKFVNAPRFDKYKNVPEVKKVIAVASEDNILTSGEAYTIIKTIDQAEKRIAMDKFKNKQVVSDDVE